MRASATILLFLFCSGAGGAENTDTYVYIAIENFKSASIRLNIRKGRILIRHFVGGSNAADSGFDWCDQEISDEDVGRVHDTLSAAGFFSWDESYNEPGVMDGWRFTVEVFDGTKRWVVRGNRAPAGFEMIERLLQRLQTTYTCGMERG